MNKDYLKQKVRSRIKKALISEVKYGQQLQPKHFGSDTGNPVITYAWNKQDQFKQAFKTNSDTNFYYKNARGEWQTVPVPAGRKLELMSKDMVNLGDPDTKGMPATTSSRSYAQVKPVTGNYSAGYIAVNRIAHQVGGAKTSENLLSNQKMGKMAEYALKQAINGEPSNFKEARVGADVAGMYTAASRKEKKAAADHYQAVYDAASSAIGQLANVKFAAASVPPGRQALVDVEAQITQAAAGAPPRDINIHVKYNDTKRKSGIPAGKELSRKKGHTQTLVATEEGDVYIKTELPDGTYERTELAEFGARNPSTLRWKGARDKFIGDLASRKPPVTIPDDKFDINITQTAPHRADFLKMLGDFGYPDALTAYFNKEYPINAPSGGPITAYAIFKTGAAGVTLNLEVWEFQTEGTWSVAKIDKDNNLGLMYKVKLGDDHVFNIEFRSGPASGKNTDPHGGPPQIKSGEKELPMSKQSVDTVFSSAPIQPTDPLAPQDIQDGLLRSLSGIITEAPGGGKTVGLIPMAAKPYHAGHHSLVTTAAAQNDEVLLFISLSDRKRKGQLTIQGADMERIWKEEIEKILPGNVTPVYGGIPVRKVYETLGDAEEKLQMDVEPPVYTVYSDPTDTARNYSAAYRMKYFPTVASEGYVKFAGEENPEAFTRGEGTPDVSGTKMRASLQCGDEAAFAEGLPAGVDKEKIFNMLCPLRRTDESVRRAQFKQLVKRRHRKAILKEQEHSLYSTFVQPFSDVVAITKLVAQDVLAASFLNLKLWFFFDPKKQKEALADYDTTKKKLNEKMKPIMDRVNKRLESGDADIMLAVLAPGFYFGAAGLTQAYNAAATTGEFLSGAGLRVPLLGGLFDEDPPDKPPGGGDSDKSLMDRLKGLFYIGEVSSSDLPILIEQEEKEEKKSKPPMEKAVKEWMYQNGVTELMDGYADEMMEATKSSLEKIMEMVVPTLEITSELSSVDAGNIDNVKSIIAKAKEVGLPGAAEFETKLAAAAKKLGDNEQFEEKADELSAEKEKGTEASDEQDEEAASMTIVAEFLRDFQENASEGAPKLQKQAIETIEGMEPDDFSKKGLQAEPKGQEYLKLFEAAKQKIADAYKQGQPTG